jgi:hypothetical protein
MAGTPLSNNKREEKVKGYPTLYLGAIKRGYKCELP